jgi:hypothetical protein
MQIQYRETRTGFDCIHMPSIDLSSLPTDHSRQRHHQKQGSSGSTEISSARKGLVKKASKISFKMLNREKDKEGTAVSTNVGAAVDNKDREKELPSRPSGGTALTATPSSGSSSFYNVSSNTHTAVADTQRSETDTSTAGATGVTSIVESFPRQPDSPSPVKTLPPIPRDYAVTQTPTSIHGQAPFLGATDEDAFESIGANKLAVRFEITVVKVCIRFELKIELG